MPVTHVNRKRDTYYLHAGKTKAGNPRYWFSKSTEGDLVDAIPEGYEVYENPDAQVFLRKIVPQRVTPFEVDVVRKGLERYAPGQHCLVDVQGEHIVVYHAERIKLDLEKFGFGIRELPPSYRSYMKVMRFTLADEDDRTFRRSGGASGARSTAGSTSGSRGAKGTSPISSRSSARISGRSRSSS